ncbi:hypothetical protein EYF80_002368 [Liparis tanakae]|uniref:Uncharacterized protein n=1 Tax=Liparis tanakae TaxID=230148 RepID=A0A4Z2JAH5_9TELE|nr:hypothetical protein EYF80_002368 [Liparis tanakae]
MALMQAGRIKPIPHGLYPQRVAVKASHYLRIENAEVQTDRRPWALSSRLVRNLSRSSTSRNRKKTSLHSGWVSNNLLPRQQRSEKFSRMQVVILID